MPETRGGARDPVAPEELLARKREVQPGFPFATLDRKKDTLGRAACNQFFFTAFEGLVQHSRLRPPPTVRILDCTQHTCQTTRFLQPSLSNSHCRKRQISSFPARE
jgi:hypothetical protein